MFKVSDAEILVIHSSDLHLLVNNLWQICPKNKSERLERFLKVNTAWLQEHDHSAKEI